MSRVLLCLAIVLTPSLLIGAWMVADYWLDSRAEARRREQQEREVSPEWLAVLAATEPTPVYDALVCEQMEGGEEVVVIVIRAYEIADLLTARPELAEVSIAASVRDRLGESA